MLRPEFLAEEGLAAALAKQAAALEARRGISAKVVAEGEPDVTFEVKEALFRIAQEALNNCARHAQSQHVEIRLASGVTLDVIDDGIGFDPGGTFPGHLGLRSMRERALGAGGTFDVISSPGQGTCVTATVPCSPPNEEAG